MFISKMKKCDCIKYLKLVDPCMGSGHILVYLFDVLMQIYEVQGYTRRDAAQSILKNNLYGLDIDDRAAQMAYFAVMMKARQYDRRILIRGIVPHVYAIQESNEINREQLDYFGNSLNETAKNTARIQMEKLLDTLVDAKEYGSILRVENYSWDLLRCFVDDASMSGQISMNTLHLDDTQIRLRELVEIGQCLAQKYDVVVTNPPYMGSSGMSRKLSNYVKKNYPDSKSDLFAVFIESCGHMVKDNMFQAMITQHAWMFLSSFEKLREKLLLKDTVNMAHLGPRAFEEIGGEVVQTTSFVLRNSHVADYTGTYCRLIEPTTQQGKEDMFLTGKKRYTAKQSNFFKIPGSPVAYWVSDAMLTLFDSDTIVGTFFDARSGLQTNDNNRFLRLWFEVNLLKIGFNGETISKKWFPHLKGGAFRRWYGNMEYVVNWEHNGKEILDLASKLYGSPTRTAKSMDKYFLPGLTWSDVSTGLFSVRKTNPGSIFDTTAPTISPKSGGYPPAELLAYLNSNVAQIVLELLAPTIHYNCGAVALLPYIEYKSLKCSKIVRDCVFLSCIDWDAYETSWDFKHHPLVQLKLAGAYAWGEKPHIMRLSSAYKAWKLECEGRFEKLKANEENLNRIFIDIYGLQDELSPDVAEKDVTVHRIFDTKDDVPQSMQGNNYVRTKRDEIVSLLSFAVGCMFGRYSLDVEGLAYAGGDWDSSQYTTYIPDEDNILPITDEEYFEDDIVGMFCAWVKKVYGPDTLEENLDFIASALGNKGNSSREVIRNYFLKDFFKDHCKTYQKRPIYWLFDSGKQNGFKALVYLHRYNADTIGNLRVDYLHRMQRVYESEIHRMQDMIDNSTNAREVAASTKRKDKLQKQLKECREYDEKIGHLALSRIELDLDDGVKVNYRKVQTARDGKFYEVLADSKNIMGKQREK